MAACESLMIKAEVQFLLCHHHELAHTRFDQAFISAHVGQDSLLPVAAPQLLASMDAADIPRIEFTAESGMGRILSAVRASRRLPRPSGAASRTRKASAPRRHKPRGPAT
jgi:hypothetical protein